MKQKKLIFLLLLLSTITVVGQNTVKGTVTDELNVPLPGVNVIVKGTSRGVTTDFDGVYAIKATSGEILEFSYVGFVKQSITVGKMPSIDVVLKADISQLNEVVVIGYGTTSKKDLVSSVASIKSEVLENQPVSRLDQALQGRASGVSVTSNNGTPGAGTTIRIRGNSSVNGNNNPLYVVDGFIAGTDFNLNTLNINDVKSVDVLKDATALAIYGTRGASGVVLITTKNGTEARQGKPIISVNYYTSIQQTANKIDIVGGQDYVDYVNESAQFVPGSSGFGANDPSLPLAFDENVQTTDWLDLISQTGVVRNADLSVTGNSENSNYFVSLNYFDQDGIVRASGLKRVNFRTNLDIKLNDRFRTGIRFNATHYKRENNKVDYSGIISSVLPVRTVYDEDGNFTGQNPISSSTQRNPEADIELRVDHDLITKLISNGYAEYELFNNFKLKTTFGAELTYTKINRYYPGILPERTTGGFGRVDTNFEKSVLNENTFTYDLNLDDHSVKVLGGFTWQKDNNESTRTEADGFPNDAVLFNNMESGDPETFFVDTGYGQRTLMSFLGRINYGYKSKYLLTLVGRYDGSSVFEKGNKYAFFPSVGVAWNMDQENFVQNIDAISKLKIRGSYGIVGEQGVKPYNSIATYNNTTTIFENTEYNGVQLGGVPSKGLKWETTKQFDLGLEMGFSHNRINFEVDYYKKTTEDLLLAKALSAQAGGGTQLQNVGSVENEGFELTLNTFNIDKKDFSWESSLSISTNKSRVLELDGRDYIALQSTGNQGGNSAQLIVGETFPSFVGLRYLGTYKTSDEIIADGREGKSFIGGPRFEDLNGDGVWNNEDAVIIGDPEPDFYGGFRNTFKYKNVSLDIFCHGSYGADIFNVRSQASFYGRGDQNLDPRVLNRWQEGINEISDVPRAGTSTSLFNPNSTVNIENGSYLRLKTVTLGYDVPLKFANLDKSLQRLNIYITGTNLFLISNFKLGDPEVNNFTDGSGFNSVSQGFASGQYPYARSITMGLKVEF